MESYYPTIENSFSKEIQYKTTTYATEIIDTAGQDEFSILNSKHVSTMMALQYTRADTLDLVHRSTWLHTRLQRGEQAVL